MPSFVGASCSGHFNLHAGVAMVYPTLAECQHIGIFAGLLRVHVEHSRVGNIIFVAVVERLVETEESLFAVVAHIESVVDGMCIAEHCPLGVSEAVLFVGKEHVDGFALGVAHHQKSPIANLFDGCSGTLRLFERHFSGRELHLVVFLSFGFFGDELHGERCVVAGNGGIECHTVSP